MIQLLQPQETAW